MDWVACGAWLKKLLRTIINAPSRNAVTSLAGRSIRKFVKVLKNVSWAALAATWAAATACARAFGAAWLAGAAAHDAGSARTDGVTAVVPTSAGACAAARPRTAPRGSVLGADTGALSG